MEMFTVTKKEDVQLALKEAFCAHEIRTEKVPVLESVGRVLAAPVVSAENLPDFVRSTVDGYAVRSRDVSGCSESIPALLRVIGETRMGETTDLKIGDYEAVYVPTGGIVPEGADSVVMIEYTENFEEEIAVSRAVAPRENLVGIGDDVQSGSAVLQSSSVIRPQQIGIMAALGIEYVEVIRKPKVAILSTGDEIVDITEIPSLGQIRDVNSYSLSAMLEDQGCEVVMRRRIGDEFDQMLEALNQAVEASDIVLLSGGSSVGTRDMTPEVINAVGDPGVLIHGVAIKPGKPTIVAKARNKAIFGLPGHPASCIISYKTVVEPFIVGTIMGRSQKKFSVAATSGFQAHVSSGRDVFHMVRVVPGEQGYVAMPVFGKSGMITLLSEADGYIEIPMEKEGLQIGEPVMVNVF